MAKFQTNIKGAKTKELTHGKHYEPKIGYERNMKKPQHVLARDGAHGGGGLPHEHNEGPTFKAFASPGMHEQKARIAQKVKGNLPGY